MQVLQKEDIGISQFSQTDWKRLTDYVALLITIAHKIHKKNASSTMENKHEH